MILMAKSKAAASQPDGTSAKTHKAAEERSSRARRAAEGLKTVSDATRLRIILMLAEGERHVGSMTEDLGQSQPAVSHHLALLRHGRIIESTRRGKKNCYNLTAAGEELARIVKVIVR